jgi:hypothetical protein
MQDTVSETKACDLLARLFKARGYAVTRNVMFREYGVEFHADGWDPRARVGFEFLSSEDDDHDDLSLTEYKALMAAQQRGELALFIIDEVEPLSAADLARAAEEFLDEVADAAAMQAGVRRAAATQRGVKRAAKKPVAKRRAPLPKGAVKKAAKKAVRKTANNAVRKTAKKPAAKTAGGKRRRG